MNPPPIAFPKLPGGLDIGAPVPTDAVDGIDVSSCATIAAAIAKKKDSRAVVLSHFGLDERRWVEIEKTWLLRLARSAASGDASLVRAYDQAYAAAGDEGAEARSLEEYATLTALLETASDPASVLREARLGAAQWAALSRAWAARMDADSSLATTFRDLVTQKRAAG